MAPTGSGAVAAPSQRQAGDDGWRQFRGPARSGISNDVGLRLAKQATPPPILWRRELGEGFSGIVAAGEYLYTLYAVEYDEFAGAFRVADGSPVWRVRIGAKYLDEWGNGPRATPTIDGDTVYVLGTGGRLLALDTLSGETRWKVEFTSTYGLSRGRFSLDGMVPAYEENNTVEFGHCSSPLIVDDLLVAYTGAGSGRSMVALDKRTGELRWSAFDNGSAHSSPVVMSIGGTKQIVQIMPQEIAAVALSGETLWQFPWAQFNISQPVLVGDDRVFASTGNGVGAVLLKIEAGGDGFAAQPLWKIERMRNAWGSSVYFQGAIYGFDNGTLRCIDATSGELRWAHRGLGKGSLIVADDLLIILGDQGVLAIAEAAAEGYRELSRLQVMEGPSWTAPSLAQGRLFLRNHKEMVCLDLSGD